MEEEKAAAYYDELSRKGEGAAKFKQGLGFSSSSSNPFSSKPSSSSLLSSFVRASSNPSPSADGKDEESRRHARVVESVQSKLTRRRSPSDERRRERRERYTDRDEEKRSSRGSRDRERDRDRHRDKDRERSRRRSRSYSPPRASHGRYRDRDHKRESDSGSRKSSNRAEKGVDYAELIEGYSQMTAAERVKAKMKLQLSKTAAKDTDMGMKSGWERFDFNKDAPLDDDDDEKHDVAEDDSHLVKNIGRSFRYSAVEARREEEVKAAHDQAMFGGGTVTTTVNFSPEPTISAQESDEDENDKKDVASENYSQSNALISEKVLSMQQGSWRDRARRLQNGSEKS